MNLGIAGRTVLITGGSKGIGYAVARQFAEAGCNLILVARDVAALTHARDRIREQFAVEVTVRALDLSVVSATQALSTEFPAIDILVNNAGAIRRGKIEEVEDALWREFWDLKVYGYINLCRAFFAHMKARRRGVIVNIIGASGEKLNANYIAGSTGNAALMAFTRALGGAAPAFGLRVVGVNPGPVRTEKHIRTMQKRAEELFADASRWEEARSFPFGRAARPEEIAPMVAFLASDLSSYTTGTIVSIHGGYPDQPS